MSGGATNDEPADLVGTTPIDLDDRLTLLATEVAMIHETLEWLAHDLDFQARMLCEIVGRLDGGL